MLWFLTKNFIINEQLNYRSVIATNCFAINRDVFVRLRHTNGVAS